MAVFGGVILIILAPIIGDDLFDSLWGVEPLAYIGAILISVGLGFASLTVVIPALIALRTGGSAGEVTLEHSWSQVTERYFELFDHDLSRPLRRILGKERELRAVLRSAGAVDGPEVKELLDEIERQAPSFRLMIANVRVLVQLESPQASGRHDTVEPSQVIRKIVDQYMPVATESNKDITWWSEPSEFGIVYSDSSIIEHIVVNLVDNAVRYASGQVEVKLSKNPSHFFPRLGRRTRHCGSLFAPRLRPRMDPRGCQEGGEDQLRPGALHCPNPGQELRGRRQRGKRGRARRQSSHSIPAGVAFKCSLSGPSKTHTSRTSPAFSVAEKYGSRDCRYPVLVVLVDDP